MVRKQVIVRDMLQVLFLHKVQILIIMFIAFFIASIYCIFTPPIYTARTIIDPPKLSNAGNSVARSLGDAAEIDFSYSWSLQKTDSDAIISIFNTDRFQNLVINTIY